MEEVPRRTSPVPLAFPCLCIVQKGWKQRGFRLPGAVGIISIVRWNLRPVIFGVENCQKTTKIVLLEYFFPCLGQSGATFLILGLTMEGNFVIPHFSGISTVEGSQPL